MNVCMLPLLGPIDPRMSLWRALGGRSKLISSFSSVPCKDLCNGKRKSQF